MYLGLCHLDAELVVGGRGLLLPGRHHGEDVAVLQVGQQLEMPGLLGGNEDVSRATGRAGRAP